MYHSIYIGDKNTWDDFHLIASSKPVVNPPEVRTMYVEVPGSNGKLDLSTVLTGDILYGNREGSWDFIIVNYFHAVTDENPNEIYNAFLNYIHGKKFRIILEDDPKYYYVGRLSISEWSSDEKYSKITIDYNLDPYKYLVDDTSERERYHGLTINGIQTVTVVGSSIPAVPTFMVVLTGSNTLSVTYNGVAYPLVAGSNKIADIVIEGPSTQLVFTGNGSVSIDYSMGEL